MDEVKLVIFHGKHSNCYYLFSTKEEWRKICLEEFDSRDKYEYIFDWYEYEVQKEIKKPEEIPENSPDWVVAEHKIKMEQHNKELRNRRDFQRELELIKAARNGDEKAAASIIYRHNGLEYESYEIETPKTVKTLETVSK